MARPEHTDDGAPSRGEYDLAMGRAPTTAREKTVSDNIIDTADGITGQLCGITERLGKLAYRIGVHPTLKEAIKPTDTPLPNSFVDKINDHHDAQRRQLDEINQLLEGLESVF